MMPLLGTPGLVQPLEPGALLGVGRASRDVVDGPGALASRLGRRGIEGDPAAAALAQLPDLASWRSAPISCSISAAVEPGLEL